MTDQTCGDSGGVTREGGPCGVYLNLGENGLCLQHDPQREDERRQVQHAGTVASARAARLRKTTTPEHLPPFEPDSLEHLAHWHRWVARSVATGLLDVRTAHEVTLSLQQLRPVLTSIGLDRRVKELERELRAYKKRAGGQ